MIFLVLRLLSIRMKLKILKWVGIISSMLNATFQRLENVKIKWNKVKMNALGDLLCFILKTLVT